MRATYPGMLVYIGIKGTVIALDKLTGAQVWRTPLRGCDFVNVALDGDSLIATARGEVFCLDPVTGRILWNNPLPGMGWGLMSVAGANVAPMAQQRRRDEAASSSVAAVA